MFFLVEKFFSDYEIVLHSKKVILFKTVPWRVIWEPTMLSLWEKKKWEHYFKNV